MRSRSGRAGADDAGGNHVAVDLAPGPSGAVGQLINVGRDQDLRFVLADSITELVALLHELGASGCVHVVETAGDEEDDSATSFAPTELSLVDQLRRWYFPSA